MKFKDQTWNCKIKSLISHIKVTVVLLLKKSLKNWKGWLKTVSIGKNRFEKLTFYS